MFKAPLLASWQLTRDCNLACLHCCTDSRPLPPEITRSKALKIARQIIQTEVPYVIFCGGEPTLSPYFWEVAEILGQAGVQLKIETNGQQWSDRQVKQLAKLPIRSIQVSLDGATQAAYEKLRPGGSLARALKSCALIRRQKIPLEVTYAPTRLNIDQFPAVLKLAIKLGAFRFNTGRLMRLGRAKKFWARLELKEEKWRQFYQSLAAKEQEIKDQIELCFRPFSLEEARLAQQDEPPATILILPNGRVRKIGGQHD